MAKAAGNSYSHYLHLPRQPSTLPVEESAFSNGGAVVAEGITSLFYRALQVKMEEIGDLEMADIAKVIEDALSLDVQERAALAERLLASLDDLDPEEADRLWAEEAERRLVELRAGRAKAGPAEEVHKKAEQILR